MKPPIRQIIQFLSSTHFASLVVVVSLFPVTNVHTVLTFAFVVPVSFCNQVQPQHCCQQQSRRISTTKGLRIRQQHRQKQLIDLLNLNIYSLQQSKHYMMDPSHDSNEYNSSDCLRPQHDVPQQESERSALPPTPPTAATVSDDDMKINLAIQFASLVGRLKSTPRTGWKIRGIPNYESVADHSWRVAILSLLLVPSSSSSSSSSTSLIQADDVQRTETSNNVDVGKIIQLALIHDIAECIVGDITPEDVEITKRMKQDMEYNAVTQITKLLHMATSTHTSTGTSMNATTDMQALNEDEDIHSNILMTLFHEYEERKTIESIIVKDLDMLDMILQAFEYEQQLYDDSTMRIDIDLSDFFTGTPPSKFQYPLLQRMATQIHKQRNEFRCHRVITGIDKIDAQEQLRNEEETEEEERGGTATTEFMILPNGSNNVDMINDEQLTASDIQFVTEYYEKQTFAPLQQQQPNAIIPMKDIMKIVQALRQWDREHV